MTTETLKPKRPYRVICDTCYSKGYIIVDPYYVLEYQKIYPNVSVGVQDCPNPKCNVVLSKDA